MDDLSEGAGEGGVGTDEASVTMSVCGFTGKFSSEWEEASTDCCASLVNPSELGDLKEAGRDCITSCSSSNPAGEAARSDGTGASEGRGLETEDGLSRGPDMSRSTSAHNSRLSSDTSIGKITSGTEFTGVSAVVGLRDNHIELSVRHDCTISLASLCALSGPGNDRSLTWSASIRLSCSASMADRSCDLGGRRPRARSASVRRSLDAISFGRAIDTA